MKMMAPNIAMPMVAPMALATLKTLERKSVSGMIGSAARRSCQTKAISSSTPAMPSAKIVGEPQAYSVPPQVVSRISAATPPLSRHGADVVDAVARGRRVQVQLEDHDQDRDDPDGQVDVEDPAPGELVDAEAAEQRPGHRGDREDGADQPHVAAALPGRDDVGDDRLRAHHEAAGAGALDGAEGDQLHHRLAQAGQHRADQEDDDRGQEDGLAPVHVAELAVDRRRARRGEQVRGDDPGEVVEAAEVADDRRQRRRHDRLVERGQEHAEHERHEDGRQRAPAQGRVDSSGSVWVLVTFGGHASDHSKYRRLPSGMGMMAA